MKQSIVICVTLALIVGLSGNAIAQKSGVTGLVIGGGAGAIVGHAIGGSTESLLIGTAIGSTVGLIIGSEFHHKSKHHRVHHPQVVYKPVKRHYTTDRYRPVYRGPHKYKHKKSNRKANVRKRCSKKHRR